MTDLARTMASAPAISQRLGTASHHLERADRETIEDRIGCPPRMNVVVLSDADARLIAAVCRDAVELIENARLDAQHDRFAGSETRPDSRT